MYTRITLILFISSICFGFVVANAQCDTSQTVIEQTTEEKLRQISSKLEEEGNALREIRLIENYESEMSEILCLKGLLEFEGRVWSIDLIEDSFILRIGSNKSDTYLPYFYNYEFLQNEELADDIAELSKGDDVKFRFNFIDTFSRDSENFRGVLYDENPDTGNLAIMMYIDLISIERVPK